MNEIIFVCIVLFIIFYKHQGYIKLYNVSKDLLCKHYATTISNEMEILNEYQGKERYQEIFVKKTKSLKDILNHLPKKIKNQAVYDAITIFDSKHCTTHPGGIWGRNAYYNSIKKAINAG